MTEHRDVERYTCPRELLPVIESALAAEGYVVEAPLQRAVGSSRVTVMTHRGSVVSLHEDWALGMATINIYRNGETGRLAVLDELQRLVSPPTVRATRR